MAKWKTIELGDLADFYSGGTPSKANPAYWGADVPWITVKDMKAMFCPSTNLSLTKAGASTLRIMPEGTVYILVRGMGLFKDLPLLYSDRPATFNQDVKALIAKQSIDPLFLAYCLQAKKTHILRLVDTAGHGTGRLDTDLLKSVPLFVPTKKTEQRKISRVLRIWDDAIDVLNALVDAKNAEYGSYSQRFFAPCNPSFSGRRNGRKSFILRKLFTERTESGLDSDALLSITMADGVISQEEVGRRDSSAEDKSKYKLILPGDIGYNTMRMWQGVCGLSARRGIVSPAYTVVTPIEGKINSRYAFHLFKSKRIIHDFGRYSQGLTSDTWNLKFPAFSEIKLFLPNLTIQSAQANYLDALKKESQVLKRHAEALLRQKRGLMQKLLTGEWAL